jgi:hypothetical protein
MEGFVRGGKWDEKQNSQNEVEDSVLPIAIEE